MLISSWEEISNTSGRSDEAQRQLLRQTLAYQTLKNMASTTSKYPLLVSPDELTTKVLPPDYELSPEDASQEPLMIELSARFPEWTSDDLEGLMGDHESEIAQLGQWRESGIDAMIKEVRELIKRDMGGVVDVDMA
jgi:nuclear pore complex protein Nup133